MISNENKLVDGKNYFTHTSEFRPSTVMGLYELFIANGTMCGDYGTSGKHETDIFIIKSEKKDKEKIEVEGFVVGAQEQPFVGYFMPDNCWGGYIFKYKNPN